MGVNASYVVRLNSTPALFFSMSDHNEWIGSDLTEQPFTKTRHIRVVGFFLPTDQVPVIR